MGNASDNEIKKDVSDISAHNTTPKNKNVRKRDKFKRFFRKPKFLEPRDENIDGFAVLSAFLGLISITCCGCGYFTCIPAILFGILSLFRKKKNNSIAIVGISLGISSIYIGIFCLIYSIVVGSFSTIISSLAFISFSDISLF